LAYAKEIGIIFFFQNQHINHKKKPKRNMVIFFFTTSVLVWNRCSVKGLLVGHVFWNGTGAL
jgi:hypothetical protein